MNLRLDVKSSPLLRCAGCKQTGRLPPQQAVTSEHANRQLQIYTHIPNIHLTDLNIHWHPIQQPAVCVRECVCVCVCLPDDLDQLAHVDVVRYQELGLVQNRQLFLSLISLNDDLQQQRHTTNRKSVSNTERISL